MDDPFSSFPITFFEDGNILPVISQHKGVYFISKNIELNLKATNVKNKKKRKFLPKTIYLIFLY
jgi:hypothetical protein